MEKRIIKSLLTQISIIGCLLLFTYLLGWQETENIFKKDIGSIIMTIGVLWSFAIFFGFADWPEKIFGIFCGMGLFITGFALYGHGLTIAIITMGIYLIIVAALTAGMIPLPKVFFIGIIIAIIGYCLNSVTKDSCKNVNLFKPTKEFEKIEIIEDGTTLGENDKAIWTLNMQFPNYYFEPLKDSPETGSCQFIGTKKEAEQEALRRFELARAKDPFPGPLAYPMANFISLNY